MHTPFVLFLGDIGGSELMLIMVVILIFFGANKIPELARGLGKGIREFKDASTEIRKEFEQAGQTPPPAHSQFPGYAPPSTGEFPAAPVAEAGSGFDPWAAAPAAAVPPALPTAAAPYIAPTLPPNLAPQGTQPRQPYQPAASDA